MSDFLIQNLRKKYKIAYLSRGYKRKSSGFLFADEQSSVDDLGDEAFMLAQKWKGEILIAVDSDRRRGIETIKQKFPKTELFILDDAMQHRWVRPSVCIQLSPFRYPFFKNFIFPSGTLRDLCSEVSRADLLIFTKADQANQANLDKIKSKFKNHVKSELPIFVSSIQYGLPLNLKRETITEGSEVIAVAGLASNISFFEKVKSRFSVLKCVSKPDHYRYLPDFFEQENLSASTILCTEKDFYKIIAIAPQPELVFYLPISIQIFPEQKFLATLDEAIYK